MCGIAGIAAQHAQRSLPALQDMVGALRHRGPDETGTCEFANCILGHARLNVIDLGTGKQPMFSTTSRTGISFNGEIYGYRNLRERLSSRWDFRTRSDTEVILALYSLYGRGMMSHLPGMFAFAIWDEQYQQLFCARDRFGEKPFYYAVSDTGEFLFGSEIKAILASGKVDPVLSIVAVAQYLRCGYMTPRQTIYSKVQVLPPAHTLTYKEGTVHVERYWSPPPQRAPMNLSDASEEFRDLLVEAVQRQLVADVEVGAFLSGGLDSSTLVSIAAQNSRRLRTYSFGYESRSELPYARAVASAYGTEHMELCEGDLDIGSLLVETQNLFDEPFYDSAAIPMYALSRLAAQHGKVVLSGDGADELIGGYEWWYLRALYMQKGLSTPAWLLPFIYISHLYERQTSGKLEAISDPAGIRIHPRQLRWRGIQDCRSYSTIVEMHQAQKAVLSRSDLDQLGLTWQSREASGSRERCKPVNDTTAVLRDDTENYLPGDILVKADRCSMAHGLEVRSPFLDLQLASFCLSLPLELKVNTRSDKMVMREAFSGSWPAIVKQRPKQGFGAPLGVWLQRESVQSLMREYLQDPRKKIFQIIPFGASNQVAATSSRKAWALLILALWLESHDCRFEEIDAEVE